MAHLSLSHSFLICVKTWSLNKTWSLDFSPPLSSINILPYQQNTINRRLRLYGRVWVETGLINLTSSIHASIAGLWKIEFHPFLRFFSGNRSIQQNYLQSLFLKMHTKAIFTSLLGFFLMKQEGVLWEGRTTRIGDWRRQNVTPWFGSLLRTH